MMKPLQLDTRRNDNGKVNLILSPNFKNSDKMQTLIAKHSPKSHV